MTTIYYDSPTALLNTVDYGGLRWTDDHFDYYKTSPRNVIPERAPRTSRSLFPFQVPIDGFAGPGHLALMFWHRKAAPKPPGFGRQST